MVEKVPYYIKRVIHNYDNPFWRRQLVRARILEPIQWRLYGDMDRVRVMEEDWDNLIVLDACRADLFEETIDIERFDSYDRVRSAGSNTTDWSYRNFGNGDFGDTVYVSGSPVMPKMAGESFHQIYEAWEDAWDDEVSAIMPEPIADKAREAIEECPDKRIIVHFIQPHVPFVPTPELNYHEWYVPPTLKDETDDDPPERPANVFDAQAMGLVSREEVWDGYRQNLEFVMDVVFDLIDDLPNKTVLTSDHGNMLGERAFPIPIRIYGHPTNLFCSELIEVPWATVEGESRREVSDDGTRSQSYANEEKRKEKLRYLGYVE